jgi:hypothetical protein
MRIPLAFTFALLIAFVAAPGQERVGQKKPPTFAEALELAAGLAAIGSSVTRRYVRGEDSIQVDVTANSPMVGMMSMLFNSPALVQADGGEIVKYGAHRAILKKAGDNRHELQLLMHDAHLIKVDASGLDADALFKVFDQAFVDRLEKPLGR